MITLNGDELNKLQEVELEILVEIDRICRKNNIKYSLTGGTLLGAVRHGGFIPWDDDADISMLRGEYVKFQQACKTDLDHERFYFQDIENTVGYRWGYGKVRRKNSVFLRENQEFMPYEQGIFVDVFPRDGIPDDKVENLLHGFSCFLLRKVMWSVIGKRQATSCTARFIYTLLSNLSQRQIINLYRLLIKWSNRGTSRLVRALTFPLPGNIVGYERSWYSDYTEILFAGHKLQAERGYLDWLKREFGDYMTLPPPEKRKTHLVSKIKFPNEGQE